MLRMNLCSTCRKLVYRTDACKGVDVSECGRTDGGSKKLTNRGGDHETHGIANIPNSSTIAATNVPAAVIENDGMAAGAGSSAGGSSGAPASDVEPVALNKKGEPRKRAPKGTFDRKAWQRDAARRRRERERAERNGA